jgi:D-alanyl-D-alanine dipeptidase
MRGWGRGVDGANSSRKSGEKPANASTLAGMNRTRCFRLVVFVAALTVVCGGMGFSQTAASEEASKTEQSLTQQVFRITPVRPIAELRAEALKATPPEEHGMFARSSLVELTKVDPSIHLDIRYATSNNVFGEAVYEQARAFLQRRAAFRLKRVSAALSQKGYGLLVYDAYRPWYVTKILWEATPVDKREFVADPAQGSQHNRGCAVDLTLYDLKSGAAVGMPSGYDEMTPRSYADYAGGKAEEREHRAILREAMESEGFVQRPNEWWHFDCGDGEKYGILNLPFDQISDSPQPLRRARVASGPTLAEGYSEQVYRVGGGIAAPRILKNVEPEFSDEARRKHVSGTVVLSLVVDASGMPRDIRVTRGLGYGLDEKAVEAIEQWRFAASTLDGNPVAVEINAEINFHL